MNSINELLKFRGDSHPDRKALFFEGKSYTYSELIHSIERYKEILISLGLQKGEKFAILELNTPDALFLFYAGGCLGIIPVILNWRLTKDEIQYILNDSNTKLLFFGKDFQSLAKEISISKIQLTEDLLKNEKAIEVKSNPILESDIFIQLYTSGTTGFPKGVPLSNKNLLSVVRNLATELPGFGADTVNLVCAPFFHIGGIGYSLLTTYIGGEIILFRKFDAEAIAKSIQDNKITNALLVPAMLQAIVSLPQVTKVNFSSLRNIQHGGSPISLSLLRKAKSVFGCYFTGAYGLTETSGISTLLRFDLQEKGLSEGADLKDIQRLSSVGKASPEMNIRIIKDNGDYAISGEIGEVCIKGDYVFQGYANEINGKAFDENGWFHTGDIGLIEEDGYLYLLDRKNDMILSKSENIYPIEVERVLAAHPSVLDVAVVGLPDEEFGEIIAAFLVGKEKSQLNETSIISFAKQKLARYKIPRKIFFVEEIPRNLSGKILRKELKEKYK
jgi:acyl-CoA synthetase (AMP-forming)/AMP-acid ligase II